MLRGEIGNLLLDFALIKNNPHTQVLYSAREFKLSILHVSMLLSLINVYFICCNLTSED